MIQVFSLVFDADEGRFIDDELVAFQAEHMITDISEHMVQTPQGPVWALLVRAKARGVASPTPSSSATAKRASTRRTWRPADPEDAQRYDVLRDWRNQRAVKDGVPGYAVLTNQTLAAIATQRPNTLTALAEVHGMGPSRMQRYGEELLALLALPDEAAASVEPGGDDG